MAEPRNPEIKTESQGPLIVVLEPIFDVECDALLNLPVGEAEHVDNMKIFTYWGFQIRLKWPSLFQKAQL